MNSTILLTPLVLNRLASLFAGAPSLPAATSDRGGVRLPGDAGSVSSIVDASLHSPVRHIIFMSADGWAHVPAREAEAEEVEP